MPCTRSSCAFSSSTSSFSLRESPDLTLKKGAELTPPTRHSFSLQLVLLVLQQNDLEVRLVRVAPSRGLG